MKKIAIVLLSTVVCGTLASAKIVQQFEPEKDTSHFNGKPEVSLETNLVFNYQGLSQTYQNVGMAAQKDGLQAGLTLPSADFDINAKVMSGFNVKLETMLSSHG
ncbi:MAG: hypothetical protein PHR87_12780 [Sulfurospirillaceae bacterium]|nr:hypothetical protein [Sulfurospirillaceae bacterium]